MSGPVDSGPYAFGERIERVVAHHARSRPHAVAVQQGERTLLYGALHDRAQTVGAAVRHLGVAPGRHVAVCAARSPELVTVLLGILRAGAAYVAIDPRWPRGRVDHTLRDVETTLFVTDDPGALSGPAQGGTRTVSLASLLELGRTAPVPEPVHDGTATASVFYTSGSTGRPKGVLSPHRGTIRTVVNCPTIPLDRDSVFLQAAPLPWDLHSFELWAPLLNGGRCVLLDEGTEALDAEALDKALRRGVNSLWLTSSLFGVMAEERIGVFGGLRLLVVGGERVPVAHARRVLTEFPGLHMVNGYGPAEGTIFAASHVIRPDDIAEGSTEIPIGTPLPRTAVILLGPDGRPTADGEAGEIAVGGDGVALGYASNHEESAQRFFTRDGMRFYRTGDLAVRDTEGLLRYRGRTDQQFKIRGVRIEAGEVEAVLEDHPEVTGCCVLPLQTAAGRVQLAAAYTTDDQRPVTDQALKQHAAGSLLDAMVPTLLRHLARLPLSANGKVDRGAVETLLRERADAAGDPCAGRGPAEPSRQAADATPVLHNVREILGLAHLGEDDDLVLAGADSLDVIRLAARLGSQREAHLTAADIYELRTPRALADHCAHAAAPGCRLPAADTGHTVAAPLSHSQRECYDGEMASPGAADFMILLGYALTGPLRPDLLQQALNDVVAVHPVLRTAYPRIDGSPVQRVLAPEEAVVVMERAEAPQGHKNVQELAQAVTADWWTTPFSLEDQVPLRARLCRLAQDRYLFCVHVHHVAFDGWAESVFMDELSRAYAARVAGRPHAVAPRLSYGAFSVWESSQLADWASRDLPFWKEELAALPEPFRPAPARTAVGPVTRLERILTVDAETVRRLARAAALRGGPTLAALLAGSVRALSRTFGLSELTVGSVTTGRFEPDLEQVIGCFVNPFTVVLSKTLEGGAEVLLQQAVTRVVKCLRHVRTPFGELVRTFAPHQDGYPWLQVWVVLQGQRPHGALGDHVTVEPVRVPPPNTGVELLLEAFPHPDGSWDLVVGWRADGITTAQAEALVAELRTALGETADCA
jgi:mycobactin peptide synthetase MbtE